MKSLKLYLALTLAVLSMWVLLPSKSFAVDITFSGDFRTQWWFWDIDFNRDNENTWTVMALRFQSIMTAQASENVKGVLFLRTGDFAFAGSSGDFGEFPSFGIEQEIGAGSVGVGGASAFGPLSGVIGANWKGRGFGGDVVNVIVQEAYVDVKIPQISPNFSIRTGIPGFDLGPNHLVMAFVDAPGTKFQIDVPDKFNGYAFHAKLQEGSADLDFDVDVFGFNANVPVNPNLTVGGYVVYTNNKSGICCSSTFGDFSAATNKSGAGRVGGPPGTINPISGRATFPDGLVGTVQDPLFFAFYGGDEVTVTWFDINAVGRAGNFNYIAEVVVSTGTLDDSLRTRTEIDLGGWAFDLTGSLDLTPAKANVGAKFTYASGDDPSTADKNEEHQVINPDYIYARLFWDNSVNGFTLNSNPANSMNFKVFASAEPFANVPLRLGVEFLHIRAVEDRFFGIQGGRFFDGTEEKEIGNELDLYFTYRINDNTVLNGELDFLWPGEYLTGRSGVFVDPLTGLIVDNTAAGDDYAIKGGVSIYYNY